MVSGVVVMTLLCRQAQSRLVLHSALPVLTHICAKVELPPREASANRNSLGVHRLEMAFRAVLIRLSILHSVGAWEVAEAMAQWKLKLVLVRTVPIPWDSRLHIALFVVR